jgi:hypothetical protein
MALALAIAPSHVAAQQPYPSSPYGGSPYAQPAPQYGYSQPQYGYAQPQYGYTQPQYAAPQQPYATQASPYAQQQYSQPQPYAGSPYPQQQDPDPQSAAPAQSLNADQLEQMLAPVALYPDTLLAQILAASTYPAQVAVADQWFHQMQSQGYGSSDQIAAGANAQTSWDPSIKALTAFPDVLHLLNRNLDWTTALGNTYYNQPQDVMQTVQVLRQRAEQAGNLQTTPQEDITNDQGYIQVAPPNPEQVYVPTYNPWDTYGQPISPYPGFSLIGALGSFFGSSPVQYALNYALGAFGHFPFGWLSWGLDWLGQAILFNHSDYYTQSYSVADWGLPHGGPRAFYGGHGSDRWHGGYDRGFAGQRGFDQHGFGQRGGWANNREFGHSNLLPANGAPYNHGNAYNHGANNINRDPREFNRGNQTYGNGYAHSEMPARQMYSHAAIEPAYSYRPQAYPNRGQTYAGRPQTYANPGFAYGQRNGYTNRPANSYGSQSYTSRPNYAYTQPGQSYRAPQSYSQPSSSRGFGNRSYQSNSFPGKQRSGGFHLFGHNSEPKGFAMSRAPKNSFGGHSSHSFGGFGGGHSSHSFGGGHSSHSFGGGHGSSHSGGHHH